ncbi:HlyD family efflux transporter periplasmic adaptor subunit [Candidatus Sulfurimonas baltica]|uniref:HlyD family secretion protein n=1 Tax=Candidatus Sulfurimonas baltica TaxID=2740404 RepID=A0A7S7RNV4_9BACT|nr:HlyD family secretion protein [Candidatus Sulfurimonas baltica]QOY52934.1 HlyD family secretion protein [Candidatus Sulfurimonas baltica]
MKIIIIMLFVFDILFAKVYYAKVEPFEIRNISSNVLGLVLYADESQIGSNLSSKPYIVIDDELDVKELNYLEDKLGSLREIVKVNEDILKNLIESSDKKRENYKKVVALKFKASVEKDREFYDLIASENLNLNTQKEINNLKIQIVDVKLRKAQLQRSIKDKNLSADGFVLYEMLVKPGQVVGISTPLAKVADTSRAVLTVYLDEPDILNAKEKVLYIDGEKTSYKISRLLNIADSKNISKYMAQIVIKPPELFSKLVKVELKSE